MGGGSCDHSPPSVLSTMPLSKPGLLTSWGFGVSRPQWLFRQTPLMILQSDSAEYYEKHTGKAKLVKSKGSCRHS